MIGEWFSVEVNGTRHSAHFYVSGRRIMVLSDYGEGGAELGSGGPEATAKRVLTKLVARCREQQMAMLADCSATSATVTQLGERAYRAKASQFH